MTGQKSGRGKGNREKRRKWNGRAGRDKGVAGSAKSLEGLGPLGLFPKGFLYPKFQANLEGGRYGLR